MSRTISRRHFALAAASSVSAAAAGSLSATAQASSTEENFDAYEVARGSKRFVYVNVLRNDAVTIDVPVGVIAGERDGPTLAVTGGIFATEYSGIEAASRLYRDLGPALLSGRVIVVPVVNITSATARGWGGV